MSRVLVVDDEPLICWTLRDHLADEGYQVAIASNVDEALEAIRLREPDVILLDVRMPGTDGLTLLEQLQSRDRGIPVIIMTAFGTLETAIRAVRGGAAEYLTKPFDLDAATKLVQQIVKPREQPVPTETIPQASESELVGQSPAMQNVFKKIALVAETNSTVLIHGESGTGKELVAEAIHANSPRKDRPFVPVHLAALNEQVIESELFGHVRGAFTGADRDRKGLLQLAEGGTVFLDEIGDVPLSVQVKLLRVIERREFTPVGDTAPRRCSFRIVAATHRPLAELVARGEFRADLFFRLSAFQIEIPPLRDRLEDLPLLTTHLLSRIQGKSPTGKLSTAFLDELLKRPWLGNVRELLRALETASILARDGELRPEHLPVPAVTELQNDSSVETTLKESLQRWLEMRFRKGDEPTGLYQELLGQIEPVLFTRVLEACQHQRGKAAEMLGIHRGTLRDKLRQHQMDREN